MTTQLTHYSYMKYKDRTSYCENIRSTFRKLRIKLWIIDSCSYQNQTQPVQPIKCCLRACVFLCVPVHFPVSYLTIVCKVNIVNIEYIIHSFFHSFFLSFIFSFFHSFVHLVDRNKNQWLIKNVSNVFKMFFFHI